MKHYVKYRFPKGFLWGVSTSAYQVEGGWDVDGKGLSIWDDFAHTSGRVLGHATGDVACDHYHRFRGDVGLMKGVGVNAYRFSVSWSRVFPKGFGRVNRFGLRFYQDLVDGLLGVGISPVVTLYHWDLPLELQKRGGWLNKQMPLYFEDYARFLFENLEGVKYWITINEPWLWAYSAYSLGVQPPALKNFKQALQAFHNLLLAHGLAVQEFNNIKKGMGLDSKIGIVLNLVSVKPYIKRQNMERQNMRLQSKHLQSARLYDMFRNRWVIDAVLKARYPDELFKIFKSKHLLPTIKQQDLEVMDKTDFLGLNYYHRHIIKYDKNSFLGFKKLDIKLKRPLFREVAKGLFETLMKLKKQYQNPNIIITENGIACKDKPVKTGSNIRLIHDSDRISFLKFHIKQAWNAINKGVRLKGFFVWSLLDNFEWLFGYSKRFGLVYVDFKTQQRFLKDSAYFYKQVIKNNGL